jgi:hypothetical protein
MDEYEVGLRAHLIVFIVGLGFRYLIGGADSTGDSSSD